MRAVLLLAPICSLQAAVGRASQTNTPPVLLPPPLQIILILTALTVLPAMIVSVTPFLRISIVLHFLRQALGTQSAPSNQVLIGLALFFSLVLVKPVASRIYETAWVPYERGEIDWRVALEVGAGPLKSYLLPYCREQDIQLLVEYTRRPAPSRPEELSLDVIVPAYILSELRIGFQIGAVLFFPFLIIDVIVASVTLSIGMVQLPPVMVSAPFKILLFVLVDGWNLVLASLLRSFQNGGSL